MSLSMNQRRHDWSYARDAILARMADLRWTAADLHRASGLSDKHIRTLLGNGADTVIPRDVTLWKLCDALGWTQDSIDLVLAGDQPVLVDDSGPISRLDDLAGRLAEIEAVAQMGLESVRTQEQEMAKFFRLHQRLEDAVRRVERQLAELRQARQSGDADSP
jgi:DNA-binding Xre family transcriptional regulator